MEVESDTMERIKVLHTKRTLSADGATSVLLNMATELQDKVQFDFLLYEEEGNDWAWKFEELGGKIFYRETKKKGMILKKLERIRLYRHFFRDHPYNIVHIDTDNMGRTDVLSCAKKSGVQQRIYHSHNSKSEKQRKILNFPPYIKFLKTRIAKLSTDLCACSREAAEWMFPQKSLQDVKIIKNGIYTEKYKFNISNRLLIRKKYGIEDCFVIGCVARFTEQKNHAFLIDIFVEVAQENAQARLLLIGDGELKSDIQKKVQSLQLEDKVIFVGITEKVEEYLSAMDLYVMPSWFEGLSLTFIEAQTAGLYCFATTNISRETQVCDRMEFVSLEESSTVWKDRILSEEVRVPDSIRAEAWRDVVVAGFDIKDASQELLKIYQS